MIYKRRKGVYWYEFVFKGERIRESTRQTNPRVARQVEAARKTQLAKGEVGIKDRQPVPIFSEFAEKFLEWVAVEKADKPNTVAFYRERTHMLLSFPVLKNAPLDHVDEKLVPKQAHNQWTNGRFTAVKLEA